MSAVDDLAVLIRGALGLVKPEDADVSGAVDPAPETGSDGDMYLNTASRLMFGPKTDGAWGAGFTADPTNEMKALAQAVVGAVTAGLVANIPGTVTATGVPGVDVADGAAAGGLIAGMLPAPWAAIMTAAIPAPEAASNLASEAAASTTYLTASALVGFASGKIEGSCSATATSPGPLVNGKGSDGTISGLDGSAWVAAVGAALGSIGPLGGAVYDAIAGFLMDRAKAAYGVGQVVGGFVAGGGPMTVGAGAAGTVAIP